MPEELEQNHNHEGERLEAKIMELESLAAEKDGELKAENARLNKAEAIIAVRGVLNSWRVAEINSTLLFFCVLIIPFYFFDNL